MPGDIRVSSRRRRPARGPDPPRVHERVRARVHRVAEERKAEEPLVPEHTRGLQDESAPDRSLEQAEERDRLWSALRQVPAEFRSALVLFDIEGCSYDEVAAIEGVAVGTVKSRLSRGRAHLRRLLGEPEEERPAGAPGTPEVSASSNLGRRGS